MECSYCHKLKSYNYGEYIFETDYWIIFLAPNQSNLGTCVIALKRHYEKLSGLKTEEWSDFSKIVDILEHALKKAFDVTMFNWGCLLNSFYLEDPPKPHLHWHFIPRYNHKVQFEGIDFEDPYFGYMRPRPPQNISEEIRKKIIAKIKENL